MGKFGEALEELDRAKGLTEDGRGLTSARAYVYARSGQAQQAQRLLAKLEPLADEKPLAYEIAAIHAALGSDFEPGRLHAPAGRAARSAPAATSPCL